MNNKIQNPDDLTQIKYIGDSVQMRLRKSLHVYSYADLANLSVDTIETNLKADNSIPAPLKTRKKIKQWVIDAALLAETPETQPTETEGSWEPIDSFVLEFQRQQTPQGTLNLRVAVQHVEHDANRHWDFQQQQERENLFKWMENEANLDQFLEEPKIRRDKSSPKKVLADNTLAFSWKNDVRPTQISLIQGKERSTTSSLDREQRPFLAHIQHEQPLDLEVTFALPFTPTTGDNSLRYSAQCQIHNLSQGLEPTYLEMGTAENFGEQTSISTKVSDVFLEPGIYELGILVRGERPLGANYYEFPKLNVL